MWWLHFPKNHLPNNLNEPFIKNIEAYSSCYSKVVMCLQSVQFYHSLNFSNVPGMVYYAS